MRKLQLRWYGDMGIQENKLKIQIFVKYIVIPYIYYQYIRPVAAGRF